jgi:hypothetical protein
LHVSSKGITFPPEIAEVTLPGNGNSTSQVGIIGSYEMQQNQKPYSSSNHSKVSDEVEDFVAYR